MSLLRFVFVKEGCKWWKGARGEAGVVTVMLRLQLAHTHRLLGDCAFDQSVSMFFMFLFWFV